MTSKRLSDGVGKKIVEALKKQSEIEINAISSDEQIQENEPILADESLDIFAEEQKNEFAHEDDLFSSLNAEELSSFVEPVEATPFTASSFVEKEPVFEEPIFEKTFIQRSFSSYEYPTESGHFRERFRQF